MIICKGDASMCPKELNICCATCSDRKSCSDACGDYKEPECADREEVGTELEALKQMEAVKMITDIVVQQKKLEEQSKVLKKKLVEAMEAYNVKSFENDDIKMLYVAPTTRSSIDTAKLKKEHPDIAEAYTKTSNVSASVRITVK